MKLQAISSLLVFVCLLAAISAVAQVTPDQQTEEQTLEDMFIKLKAEEGDSHASGNRDDLGPVILGNPTTAVVAVRVGLYYSFTSSGAFSEFSSLNHPFVQLSNTVGDVDVIDLATGNQIAVMSPGQIFDVRFDGTNYVVTEPDGTAIAAAGPIRFMPTATDNLFKIESILRSDILHNSNNRIKPTYRGAIEVARGRSTADGKVNLVNILELENYVKGVVANESIASFAVEALKAQAVAARGYAVANIGRYVRSGYSFDLVDSSSSQVYRGVLSEHSRTVTATEQTHGLVASYNGKIISALYSSSFGGYSDSNHWIFNSPSDQLPGLNVTPYLTGIYDGEGTPIDLTDPSTRDLFWSTIQPQGYDMCGRVNNRFSRWRITIPAASIKSRLTASRIVVISGDTSGAVTAVEPVMRMDGSNRIAIARITLSSGVVEVRGWDNLRNVLGRTVTSTPSLCAAPSNSAIAANFTLTNPALLESYTDASGNFAGVIASGGGWGHNTGMSQYGAHGRGLAGQNFIQILKAYYTGVDIGSYPIDIGRDPGTGPPTLRQVFSAPNSTGTLVIRARGLKKLAVHINDTYDLILDEDQLSAPVLSIDISPYLLPGDNTIQYNPVGRYGSATVNVNVD